MSGFAGKLGNVKLNFTLACASPRVVGPLPCGIEENN